MEKTDLGRRIAQNWDHLSTEGVLQAPLSANWAITLRNETIDGKDLPAVDLCFCGQVLLSAMIDTEAKAAEIWVPEHLQARETALLHMLDGIVTRALAAEPALAPV